MQNKMEPGRVCGGVRHAWRSTDLPGCVIVIAIVAGLEWGLIIKMDAIHDNIEQIRELGISLGLDDREIDQALHNSLKDKDEQSSGTDSEDKKEASDELDSEKKSSRFCTCKKCIKWSSVFIFITFLLLYSYCVMNLHISEANGVETSMPYQIARIIRFLALPFLHFVELTGRLSYYFRIFWACLL